MLKRFLPLAATLFLRSTLRCSILLAVPIFVLLCFVVVVLDAVLVRPLPRPPPPTDLDRMRIASGNDGLGVQNWRSLGGLPAKGGRKVKEGVAYRSCEVEGLITPSFGFGGGNGKAPVAKTFSPSINTVIDIRSKSESSAAPDRVGSDSKVVCIPLNPLRRPESIALQLHNRNDVGRLMALHPSALFGPPDGFPPFNLMPTLVVFRILSELNYGDGAVRRILNLASDSSNHPILWHCSTGKDRTGAVTAAFLLALGVSREDVVRDFLLSNYCEYERMARRYHTIKLTWLLTGSWGSFVLYGGKILRDLLFVRRETMDAAIAEVDESYEGGFEGTAYWKAQGLTEDDLERLREAMLE